MIQRLSTPEDYQALLDGHDTWLFDCDGVLWLDDQLIDGAVQVLNILRNRKKKLVFVTNNATKSRRSYKKKFDQLGLEVHLDEIYGSAYAAAVYLSSVVKLPKDKKVYVIGQAGIEEELQDEGFASVGGTDPKDNTMDFPKLADFNLDPDVAAVVCGLDTKFNYTKLAKAFQYLTRDPNCLFIATNEDSTYPSVYGLLPGAGSISAPLRFALGRDPVCTGKPASTMLDCVKAKVHFDPKRTIMVGDRLNTDILFGQNGGLATLLVLTGITTEEDITGPSASQQIVPNFVTGSVGDFRVVENA